MMEKSILLFVLLSTTILGSPTATENSPPQQTTHTPVCPPALHYNVYYSLTEQINITGIPADMSVHWETGKVYFTLISDEMKMTIQILEKNGNLSTIRMSAVGQSTCVDNLLDKVYLATDNGVFQYRDNGNINLYAASGEDVMYLAVSPDGNTIYMATWPQNRVHKITNNGMKQEMFPAIPNGHGLTIDSENNLYFVATKTSYILKSGNNIPIKIKGLPTDKMTGVFVAKTEEVYAMDEEGALFLIDAQNTIAISLGSFKLNGVNTFAMDADNNILIGIKGSILKYTAFKNNPCSSEA